MKSKTSVISSKPIILLFFLFYSSFLEGQSWHAMGKGVSSSGRFNSTRDMVEKDGIIYMAGRFESIGNTPAETSLVSWNGSFYSPVGNPVFRRNDGVNALAFQGGKLIVGGSFNSIGGDTRFSKIAIWDGCNWESIGGGLKLTAFSGNSSIDVIAVDQEKIYVGGRFRDANGIAAADYVAMWDGEKWNALGSGVSNRVYDLEIVNGELYASGAFNTVNGGSTYVYGLAKWNGVSWEKIVSGECQLYLESTIRDIVHYNNKIYLGGDVRIRQTSNSNPCDYNGAYDVVELSNGILTPLPNAPGSTYAMTIFQNRLTVGYGISLASANNILQWNGTSWQKLGADFVDNSDWIFSLLTVGEDLYVGGDFANGGGIAEADVVARYGKTKDACDFVANANNVCNNQVEVFRYDTRSGTRGDTLVKIINLTYENNTRRTYSANAGADGTTVLSFGHMNGEWRIRNTTGDESTEGKLTRRFIDDIEGKQYEKYMTYYTTPTSVNEIPKTIHLDYYPVEGCPAILSLRVFMHPPPTMFLHGINSEGKIWNDMMSELINRGWNSRYLYAPSYAKNESFLEQDDWLNTEINTYIDDTKMFVNKINVVGHSMGGLVARGYLTNYTTSSKRKIHKLITLNTPHSGSELANFVTNDLRGRILGWMVFGFGNNVNEGGVNSLRVDSDEIRYINSRRELGLGVHAIGSDFQLYRTFCNYVNVFTDVFEVIEDVSGNEEIHELLRKLKKHRVARNMVKLSRFANPISTTAGFVDNICDLHTSLLPDENDLVVRLRSQKGGLSSNYTSEYQNLTHFNIYNNNNVINQTAELLKIDVNSSVFYQQGFRPPNLPVPNLKGIWNIEENTGVIAVVGIKNNQTVSNTQSPSFSISGNTSVNGLAALYYYNNDPGVPAIDFTEQRSTDFSIPIPPNYEGKMTIIPMGIDGDGKQMDFQSFEINVTNQSCPTNLNLKEGEIFSGQYQGRTITSNSSIPELSIAEFTANNNITLTAGFEVAAGSIFKAQIGGCRDLSSDDSIDLLQTEEKEYIEFYYEEGVIRNSTSEESNFITYEDKTEVSPIVENTLNIFPNPTQNNFYLQWTSTQSENGTIKVFDLNGQEMVSKRVNISKGANQVLIDDQLPRGMYIVMVVQANNLFKGRLLVE